MTRKTVHRYVERGILPAPILNPSNGYGLWKPSDVDVAQRMLAASRLKEN